ncbi:MAG: hypothetical protein NTZ80_03865 [Patescibacteria group bacterium]|nr:hypothetical protein [Patescibacteria group bacterium]
MKFTRILLAVLFATLIPAITLAAEFNVGSSVSVQNPVKDNLISAGMSINIGNVVSGDLALAGQNLQVQNEVQGNFIGIGQNIIINGPIKHDIFAAGNILFINSRVDGDVMFAGQQLILTNKAVISGDLTIASGLLDMSGRINGNIKTIGGDVWINGNILGSANITVQKSLKFGDLGKINGTLKLAAPTDMSPNRDKVGGEIIFQQKSFNPEKEFGEYKSMMHSIQWLSALVSIILAAVLILISKNFIANFAEVSKEQIWKNLGFGILTIIILPIVAIILAVTIIGIPFAIIAALLIPILFVFVCIVDAFVIGHWILPIKSSSSFWRMLLSYIIGTAVLMVIYLISCIHFGHFSLCFIGFIVKALVFLVALGAVVQIKWEHCQILRKGKKI